jgi:hypothetical protein
MKTLFDVTKTIYEFFASKNNIDPLNFVGIILTAIISLYIFKNETSISFVKERHDKLLFPLFNLLEPILYQKLNMGTLSNAFSIISANKNLADGKLLEVYYNCYHFPSQKTFNALCRYIDLEYDKSCKKLGLKKRGFFYRNSRHQYKNKLLFVTDFIGYILTLFFIAAILYILLIFYIALLISCLSLTNIATSFLLIVISIFLFLKIISFISKEI